MAVSRGTSIGVPNVGVALHTPVGLLRGVTQKLGMSSMNILVPAHPVMAKVTPGMEVLVTLEFGPNSVLQVRARVMLKKDSNYNGNPAVAMGLSVSSKSGSDLTKSGEGSAEKRKRERVKLNRECQAMFIAQHPFLPNVLMKFRVQDLNSDGMRLMCRDAYPVVFPGTKIRGQLILKEKAKPLDLKCLICRVRSGAEYQGHTLGVRFENPAESALAAMVQYLVKDEGVALEDLDKAGFDTGAQKEKAEFSRESETGSATSTGTSVTGNSAARAAGPEQTVARLVYEVRQLQSYEEWQAILSLRREIHAAAGQVAPNCDLRSLMDLRDGVSVHLFCGSRPDQAYAAAALIPFGLVNRQQVSLLANISGTTNLPKLCELTNYYLSPKMGSAQVLGAIMRKAIETAAQMNQDGVFVFVPPAWSSLFEACGLKPKESVSLATFVDSGGDLLIYNPSSVMLRTA